MIVVNTSNEISTDISARFRLADGLLRQNIVARVSINKLTLTYVSSLIVPQLSIAIRIAGNLNKPPTRWKLNTTLRFVPAGLGMLSSMPAGIGIKERIMRDIEIWRTSEKTIKKVNGTMLILIIAQIFQRVGSTFLTLRISANMVSTRLSTMLKIWANILPKKVE